MRRLKFITTLSIPNCGLSGLRLNGKGSRSAAGFCIQGVNIRAGFGAELPGVCIEDNSQTVFGGSGRRSIVARDACLKRKKAK
jgi:hypothetical protein